MLPVMPADGATPPTPPETATPLVQRPQNGAGGVYRWVYGFVRDAGPVAGLLAVVCGMLALLGTHGESFFRAVHAFASNARSHDHAA